MFWMDRFSYPRLRRGLTCGGDLKALAFSNSVAYQSGSREAVAGAGSSGLTEASGRWKR
jgi:hypothetical protein